MHPGEALLTSTPLQKLAYSNILKISPHTKKKQKKQQQKKKKKKKKTKTKKLKFR